jgi:hypothetical protein
MKRKSKIFSNFSLGLVAPFVANLRDKVAAMSVLTVLGPSRLTFSLVVQETPTKNISNAERCSHPMHALRQARHSWEDQLERPIGRKAEKLKKAVGPTVEARKMKTFAEIEDSESDSNDNDDGIFGKNDNTNYAEAPNDSNYFEGDD